MNRSMRTLINKIKQVWHKVKKLFGGKNMFFEFPDVKVKLLEDKIDVKTNAATDGKHDLPTTEQNNLSGCENEATIQAEEFRSRQVTKATEYLRNIENKIVDSASRLGQENFHIAEFKNRIDRTINAAEGKLSNLKDIFLKEDRQVRNFKLENHLTREPKTLTVFNIIIGLIVITVLFYIELQVNGNLLAPAMGGGKAAGIAMAGGVAGLNVLVSFVVGYITLKNFHHVSLKRKIFSKVGLFLYSIFIIYLNCMLGAFRALHEKTGDTLADVVMGTGTAVEKGNPVLFWTVEMEPQSLILVFIGIGFALGSLIDGYLFDDRYPGFGSIGKVRDETKKEIDRIREHISEEINIIFKSEIRKTNEKKETIINSILRKEWIPNITALQNVFDGYKKFIMAVGKALIHAIDEYRLENEKLRSTPVPKYFGTDLGKTISEDIKNPNNVFAGFSSLYLNKNEIEKKIEEYQNKIQNEGNNFINQLNSYNEEINKKIEEVRNKYNVSTT